MVKVPHVHIGVEVTDRTEILALTAAMKDYTVAVRAMLVDKYPERRAPSVCDWCGKPGHVRREFRLDKGTVLNYFCDNHHEWSWFRRH